MKKKDEGKEVSELVCEAFELNRQIMLMTPFTAICSHIFFHVTQDYHPENEVQELSHSMVTFILNKTEDSRLH